VERRPASRSGRRGPSPSTAAIASRAAARRPANLVALAAATASYPRNAG
jgi:hypothetical protein